MRLLIPLLLVLSLASDAGCKPAEFRKLFGVQYNASRGELHERKEAPPGGFPFYVSLRRTVDGSHFCAGTLISPFYVLTSASCLDRGKTRLTAEEITVNVGTHLPHRPENAENRTTAATRKGYIPEYGMRVENVTVHEKYSNGSEGRPPYDARHDISLLKLKTPSNLCGVLLPLEDLDCCNDEDLLNVGPRRVESEPEAYAESLEMAVFTHMSYNNCETYFRARPQGEFFGRGKEGNLTKNASLCVSGEGEYCQLDKGSSLVRYTGTRGDFVMVALASEATQECSFGAPYVFSSISSHMEWILGTKGVVKDISGSSKGREACKLRKPTPRVAGGTMAQPGRFPYAVSVRRTQFPDRHVCQGVLISPSHVLTAASCILDEDSSLLSEITAYIGGIHATPALDPDDEEISATEIIVHPNQRPNRNAANLAIIVLEKESEKKPVRLPVLSKRPSSNPRMPRADCADRGCCETGTRMRVFGWGSTSAESSFSRNLQTGEMDYISREQCISVYDVRNISCNAVCAGHRFSGVSLCRGDDGTPLLLTGGVEDILIGIGFTNTTGDCDAPSEFLRVAFFMQWIKQHVSIV